MIRKLVIVLTLSVVAASVNSQVLITLLLGDKLNQPGLEFGLEGGFNYSGNSGFESNTSFNTFNLGFYFDITLKNQWSLYTGVLIKSEVGNGDLSSADLSFLDLNIQDTPNYPGDGVYSQSISYFYVPIFLKYKLKNHFYFEGGPQAGLMHGAKVEYEHDTDDIETIIKEVNTDQYKRLDAGMGLGLGYRLRKGTGMTIGVKYYQGLVNVMKGQPDSKNHSLYLKANIPIGAKSKD